jgi:hypothetical protein
MEIRKEEQQRRKHPDKYRTPMTIALVDALVPILARSFLSVEMYKPPLGCDFIVQIEGGIIENVTYHK